MLRKHLHHLVRKAKESSTSEDPFSFMLPDQFCNLTRREFVSRRLVESNQKSIKREVSQYTILKSEKYYEEKNF